MPNVEETELFYPMLYLWRQEQPDSGGAGRCRGGNSMELGVVVHGVETIAHHTASAAHCAVPGPPLAGGYPSSLNTLHADARHRRARALRRRRVPAAPEDVAAGSRETLPAKAFGVLQGARDVYVMSWTGAGGYGDPMERPLGDVLADVVAEAVTAGEAERLYGVVHPRRGGGRRGHRAPAGRPSARGAPELERARPDVAPRPPRVRGCARWGPSWWRWTTTAARRWPAARA